MLSASVEKWTGVWGPQEPNWARRLLGTLRSRFLVSSLKLWTSRSHMSSTLPLVLWFEVYVCTAIARSRGEWVKLRAFGQINDLISSIDLQCTCSQSRILAVKVWRRTLQSRFREQFLSTSRFTDIKNGRSQRHENKLTNLRNTIVYRHLIWPNFSLNKPSMIAANWRRNLGNQRK